MNQWSFGGTDLSTIGVITEFDDYLDLPEARAGNIKIPFMTGTAFVTPYYDETTLQMGMTITETDADALEAKLDTLKALLSPRIQQTLSRTLSDSTVRTAQAIVNKRLGVVRPAPWVAKLVIEFELASPFFRLSTPVPDNSIPVDASPLAWVVDNPGTAPETQPTIIMTGPLENTVMTNAVNGFILSYNGAIASPRVVTLSFSNGQWLASDDLGASVISNFSHSGGAAYMQFEAGENPITITDESATTGEVGASFYPPFL